MPCCVLCHLQVALDPSSSFIATSSSDKSLCLFDFYSGEMIARLYGHSEVVTGIKFSNDLQRIYTTSGDGYAVCLSAVTYLLHVICICTCVLVCVRGQRGGEGRVC